MSFSQRGPKPSSSFKPATPQRDGGVQVSPDGNGGFRLDFGAPSRFVHVLNFAARTGLWTVGSLTYFAVGICVAFAVHVVWFFKLLVFFARTTPVFAPNR